MKRLTVVAILISVLYWIAGKIRDKWISGLNDTWDMMN